MILKGSGITPGPNGILEALPWMDSPGAAHTEYLPVSSDSNSGQGSSLSRPQRPTSELPVTSSDATSVYHPQGPASLPSYSETHEQATTASRMDDGLKQDLLSISGGILDAGELSQHLTPRQIATAVGCLNEFKGRILNPRQRSQVRQKLKHFGFPIIHRIHSKLRSKIVAEEKDEEEMIGFETEKDYRNGIFGIHELPPKLTRRQMKLVDDTVQHYPPGSTTKHQKLYQRTRLRGAGLPIRYRKSIEKKVEDRNKSLAKDAPRGKARANMKRKTMYAPLREEPSSMQRDAPAKPSKQYKQSTVQSHRFQAIVGRPPPTPPGMNRDTYARFFVSPEDQAKLDPNQQEALSEFYAKQPLSQPLPHHASYARKLLMKKYHKLRGMGIRFPPAKKGVVPLPHEALEDVLSRKRKYDHDRYLRVRGKGAASTSTAQPQSGGAGQSSAGKDSTGW